MSETSGTIKPKGAPPPTPEQRRAIETTDRTVLLSAAAGSGKTKTLTDRLISMIIRKENPLRLDRMLVVTFTREAASELRTRIERRLGEELAKDPTNASLLEASLLLPSAKIRTIDSFCNDLVRGHTETLGIKSRYRIPDEAEHQLLAEEILDALIKDAYDGVYAPPGLDIAYLCDCTVGVKKEKELAPTLLKLFSRLENYTEREALLLRAAEDMEAGAEVPFFSSIYGKAIRDALREMLRDHKNGLRRALTAAEEEGDALFLTKLGPLTVGLIDIIETAERATDISYSAVREALSVPLKPKISPQAPDGRLSESGLLAKHYRNRVIGDLTDFLKKYLVWEEKDIPYAMRECARLNRSAYLLLHELAARLAEEKRARGLCTFADLERYAYELLWSETGERTPLAEELRDSFDSISIDEYQDVNEIQHRIFVAIAKEDDLFMVGDIKQSIYGFRGACPDIFASLRSEMPAFEENKKSAVLYLTENFRSAKELIDFNNGIFDFLFEHLGESIGYKREDRLNTSKAPDASLPLPKITYLYKGRGSGTDYDQYALLAERIKPMLDAHTASLNERKERARREGDEEEYRRITEEKNKPLIAILYRGGDEKPPAIAKAAEALGISVCALDKQRFFEIPEILLALSLLNTVNNPHRDIYLAALLRSPLYSFTMNELIEIRNEGGDARSLLEALTRYTSAHPDFHKGVRFLHELSFFREQAKNSSADKLCNLLFTKTALYSLASEDGKRQLNILYDYARTYERNSFHGFYRFVSGLNRLVNEGGSLGAERERGNEKRVVVRTMHKSKGLQFPITFIIDAAASKRDHTSTEALVFHPAFGLQPMIEDQTRLAKLDHPLRRAALLYREREESDEALRTLYVALTRAEKQSYIIGQGISKPETVRLDAALMRAFPSPTMLRGEGILPSVLAAVGTNGLLASLEWLDARDRLASDEAPNADVPTPEPPLGETHGVAACEAELRERFSFQYPYKTHLLPAKLSVSRLSPDALSTDYAPFDPALALSAFGERLSLPSEEEEENEERPTVPAFLSGRDEDAAREAGIATHLFLQFCRFESLSGAPDGKDTHTAVKEELARLVREGFLHQSEAERVRLDELCAFAKSELLSRILCALRVHRELRFNTMLPASLFSRTPGEYEGEEIFTQGVMDLVLENADGTVSVLDYKTDRLSPRALSDRSEAERVLLGRHRIQLHYYREAAERIFRKRARAEIYSLHAGECFALKEE